MHSLDTFINFVRRLAKAYCWCITSCAPETEHASLDLHQTVFPNVHVSHAAQHLMGFAASRLGTALLVWLPGGALYFAVILYSAAVMVNFLGCGWYFVARAEDFDGTWLSRVGALLHLGDPN